MKILVPLAVAATLVACGKTEQTGTAPTSSSTETWNLSLPTPSG